MTEVQFFFYGSWTEGFIHYDRLRHFIRQQRPAEIRGTVYRLAVGFPVVLATGQDRVPGTLMSLQASDLLLQLLDQFHGINQFQPELSLYQRAETGIQVGGEATTAWTYFLNPQKLPKSARLIEDGNWPESLRVDEPVVAKLTARQREYIAKLGAITGREIVPIQDLSLYRELMKLELIVDKGRRLALSKLGHEVCQYLV